MTVSCRWKMLRGCDGQKITTRLISRARHPYQHGWHRVQARLGKYFNLYKRWRPHSSLTR